MALFIIVSLFNPAIEKSTLIAINIKVTGAVAKSII
jgi:hypothetical protein